MSELELKELKHRTLEVEDIVETIVELCRKEDRYYSAVDIAKSVGSNHVTVRRFLLKLRRYKEIFRAYEVVFDDKPKVVRIFVRRRKEQS